MKFQQIDENFRARATDARRDVSKEQKQEAKVSLEIGS